MALNPNLEAFQLLDHDELLRVVAAAIAEEFVELAAEAPSLAEVSLDALSGMSTFFPSGRWEELCHRCDVRVGDHRVDGRCPV